MLLFAPSQSGLPPAHRPKMEPGARVRVHSLKAATAQQHNGKTATLGAFLEDKGRWTVTMSYSGAELSCKPENVELLAAEGDEAVGRCFICFEESTEGSTPPIQSGCACRGDAGLAHLDCRVKAAEARFPPPSVWWVCQTCNQPFTGDMRVGLAEAYWSRVQCFAEEDGRRVSAAHNLARCRFEQGRLTEAETLQREVYEVHKQGLGPEHAYTLLAGGNLATFLMCQNKFAEAEQMLRELHEAQERVFGVEHPNTLTTISNLANCLANQGKNEDAEKMLRDVFEGKTRILGEENPDTLIAETNLAHFFLKQGHKAKAEQMLRKALAVQKRVLGPTHPNTLTTADHLAIALMR